MPQTNDSIRVPLTQGKYALIDAADAERVLAHKWAANRIGHKWYAVRGYRLNGRSFSVLLHRFILDAPDGVRVDHRNGDGLDCRHENMRLASATDNLCNRGKQRNNTSGYKGVWWQEERQCWRAKVQHERRQIHVSGRFATAEDAARAYDDAALIYHGEFAALNFPDSSGSNFNVLDGRLADCVSRLTNEENQDQ